MNRHTELRILVLDDEPFMLKLLARLLANQGFTRVVTSDNGPSALAMVADETTAPQLILCDLNMPEMDGVEFVRALVDHGYRGSLILVSGEDERTLQSARKLVQAHHINVLGTLQKPVSPPMLTRLIEQWVPAVLAPDRLPQKKYAADQLAQAIQQGELVNYYQPKVSVASGEVVGVETLVRWHHPQDGTVFPDEFIGLAESSGLIDALTEAVLVQALRDAAAWSQRDLSLKVAVNVSVDNLTTLEFPEMVTAHARSAGVAAQSVVLEVTESRLMQDLRTPLDILTRLRLRRFHLSIDDFGTGHSSLAQLRDAPFNELKIDRGFVHGAHSNGTNRAIFMASLHLAKELGMEVVAEGVEDQADWDFLKETGCDLAQGYFIARPMPASKLVLWMDAWKERCSAENPDRLSAPGISP